MKILTPAVFLTAAITCSLSGADTNQKPTASLPGFDPGSGITQEEVSKIVEWALETYKVPGAAVAIVKDGEVFLAEGYGIRNSETGDPVDKDTIFQLASVSKTFTAASFAAAVDKDLLKWETPTREILSDFSMHTDYATQWVDGTDFMTHRSGFPGFFGDLFDHLGYSRADIIHRMRFVKPGYSFRDHPEYSNLGFFLAGEMTAAAEKKTFEEVVQDSLLTPLGMKDTGKAEILMETGTNTAASHIETDDGFEVVPHNLSKVFVAAGGLASTATDLALYMQMLVDEGQFQGNEILSSEAIDRMFTPVITPAESFSEFPPINENSGFDYSPGWGVFHYNGLKVMEKGGALDGVRTIVIVIPQEKFGIAVLANMNLTALPEAVRAGVLQQMFGRPGEEDLQPEIFDRSEKIHKMLFGSMTKPEADPSITENQVKAFVGNYVNDLYGEWQIIPDAAADSGLTLVMGVDGYRGKVTVSSPSELTVEWPIVISAPEEIPFEIEKGKSASSFDFDGYTFRRLGSAE